MSTPPVVDLDREFGVFVAIPKSAIWRVTWRLQPSGRQLPGEFPSLGLTVILI